MTSEEEKLIHPFWLWLGKPTVSNMIMIIFTIAILGLALYLHHEAGLLKADPCTMCHEMTGRNCFAFG